MRAFDDLSAFEKLALIDMSYSRINTYEMCPTKYFWGYVIKEPWQFSAPAALGNIVHDVMEDHVGEEEDLSLTDMTILFEQHRPDHDPDGLIDNVLLDAGHEMMAEFVDRHSGENWDVVAKEQPFEIVIGSALVRGFIDLITREQNAIKITDWKTGKFEEAAKNIPKNTQLGIYALAASQLFPDVDKFDVELYYLRSGRRKGHTFMRSDLADVEAQVLEKITTILTDNYFHYTSNERICGFCEHATSGACQVGVKRRYKRKRWG